MALVCRFVYSQSIEIYVQIDFSASPKFLTPPTGVVDLVRYFFLLSIPQKVNEEMYSFMVHTLKRLAVYVENDDSELWKREKIKNNVVHGLRDLLHEIF